MASTERAEKHVEETEAEEQKKSDLIDKKNLVT